MLIYICQRMVSFFLEYFTYSLMSEHAHLLSFCSLSAFFCLSVPSVRGAHFLALCVLPFGSQLQFHFLPEALPPTDSASLPNYSFKPLIPVGIYLMCLSYMHGLLAPENRQTLGLSHILPCLQHLALYLARWELNVSYLCTNEWTNGRPNKPWPNSPLQRALIKPVGESIIHVPFLELKI